MSDFSSGLRSDVEAHLTEADAAVDAKLVQIEAETQSRVSALESAVYSFEIWCPRIDSSVESLQATVGWL
jgi:thymidylate synthase ThyX